MASRNLAAGLAMALAVGWWAGAAVASQQAADDRRQADQEAAGSEATTAEEEALRLVEEILRAEEGVITGRGFSYDPAGRRDPFRSLLEARSGTAPTLRPPGLPGFLIGEVELKAVAQFQGRWHALLLAPDGRAYHATVGARLYDGRIMEIGPEGVVFEQEVRDLLGARTTRQVLKRLLQIDGGGIP